MATKAQLEIPVGMRKVCQRFERWRKRHKARLPIPEALWTAAAVVAREYGVFRTAKLLRLEYGKLKRMVESAASSPGAPSRKPMFLELMPQPVGPTECLIELKVRAARCGILPPALRRKWPRRKIRGRGAKQIRSIACSANFQETNPRHRWA